MDDNPATLNTRNLMHFSVADLKVVAELLAAYREPTRDKTLLLGFPVSVEKNPVSGAIFLVDETNRQTAILRNGELHDWLVCVSCQQGEGLREKMAESPKACCRHMAGLRVAA